MTKAGFKQVMLSIDTWAILKKEATKQKISIDRLIRGLIGVSPTSFPGLRLRPLDYLGMMVHLKRISHV
jgi:hypothetical protein